MPGSGLLETGRLYLRAFRNAGRDGISMRMRLFGLLMLFCAAIVTGVLILLMGTGAFHAGEQQVRQTLEQELSYRAQAAYQEFGDISVRGVDLAETLSQTLERRLAAQKVPPAALAEEPELLNALLEETLPHLTGALEKTRASGVFLVLDGESRPAGCAAVAGGALSQKYGAQYRQQHRGQSALYDRSHVHRAGKRHVHPASMADGVRRERSGLVSNDP